MTLSSIGLLALGYSARRASLSSTVATRCEGVEGEIAIQQSQAGQ
jgi:hypothetical protein